jgi:DNA-binding protein HU-beta
MGKSMTKSALIAHFANLSGLKKKMVASMFEELAGLAYREAKNSFSIPGIGKLVLVNRKARVGRNPRTGEPIQIPAKTVVKFRIAKACKEAVLPKKI